MFLSLLGNLGETQFLAAASVATSIDNDNLGFSFKNRTVGIVSQLFARSDYREISRTLLRNFLLAIFISIIIILFKPFIIQLSKEYFTTSIETGNL